MSEVQFATAFMFVFGLLAGVLAATGLNWWWASKAYQKQVDYWRDEAARHYDQYHNEWHSHRRTKDDYKLYRSNALAVIRTAAVYINGLPPLMGDPKRGAVREVLAAWRVNHEENTNGK